MINKTILSNNITLITQKNDFLKTASVGFWFPVGSRMENDKNRGISHFTEHMLFKGTKNFSTKDISLTFDRIGGYINAFTEREDVCVYCSIPSINQNLSTVLDIMCDMTFNCIFPNDEFEKEKLVVESEIINVQDDPEECALDEVAKLVWKNQSVSKSIAGTIKNVENISVEDIKNWYIEHFVNGELVVVATGNIDEKLIISKLEKLNHHKKCKNYPLEKHYDENIQFYSQNKFVKSGFNQSQVFNIYNYKMPISEKENYVCSIFNALMGDTLSSRLFVALREETGLCYSVYSFFSFYEDTACWISYSSTDKSNSSKVLKLMNEQMEKIVSKGISDDELENAKNHLCGEELMNDLDSEYLMKRLQRNFSMGIPMLETEEIIKSIRNIEKNDIIDFVKKLLCKENKAVLVYSPKKCEVRNGK